MAILIQNAPFTTSGVSLGIDALYLDLMAIFPFGTDNAEVRLNPYPYTEGSKGAMQLAQVDGVHHFSFPPSALVVSDPWTDINGGNAHDYVMNQLALEQPQWANKMTKVLAGQ
jgi:hypothetical protein